MPVKYVDAFFASGRLRISSFRQFGKHPDELHRDAQEATGMIMSQPDSGLQHFGFFERNDNALILCASIRSDRQSFTGAKYDGCFRINKTVDFGLAVARCIPGVIQLVEGFCIYSDSRILTRKGVHGLPTDLSDPANPNLSSPEKLNQIAKQLDSPTRFFMKERRFQKESEYRIIWLLDHNAPDYQDIECPAAIQFCDRIPTTNQSEQNQTPPDAPAEAGCASPSKTEGEAPRARG